jgi:hypothetical protein
MAEAQTKKMAEIKSEVRIEIGESLSAKIMELFTIAFQQNTIGNGNTKRQLLKQYPEETPQTTASPGVSSPQHKKMKQRRDAEDEMDETMRDALDSDSEELEAVQNLPAEDSRFSSQAPLPTDRLENTASPVVAPDAHRSPPPSEIPNGAPPSIDRFENTSSPKVFAQDEYMSPPPSELPNGASPTMGSSAPT